MSGNRIISPDILDTEIFDAQELSSDGYSSYLTLPLVSISSGIFTVDPTGVLSGGVTIDPEFPVESRDRIYVEGATPGSADGYYTIDNLLSTTTFDVEEATVNSTGGNVVFFHPSGASRIGVSTDNFTQITSNNVQDALEEIDSLVGSGGVSVEDDNNPIASNVTTINFGDNLEVIDDGGGQVTVDGYNAGRAVFSIWAEENAGLSAGNYEWSFGNGDETPQESGIPVPIDCVLFAVDLDHTTTASATVGIEADGVQIATVTTSSQRNILTTLANPVNVSQGAVIGFKTVSGSGSGGGNRVAAYFRTAPFGAGAPVDSVFGRTGAVVAEASDYDADQVDFTPDGDIAATDVQAAIVEVRDDTDTKLAGKADVTHAPTHLPSGSDPLTTAAASTLTPDLANAEGAAESFARSDHIHNVPADTAVDIEAGGTSSEGVAASFARSDHVHRIIDPSDEVSASGNISTTSSSPITATGMTITPGAGTYMVWFSAYGLHNNNNAELAIGIAVSGTDVSNSERRWGGTNQSDDTFATLSTQARVSITVGQTIQGRFWKATGGGSVELEDRTLSIIKVDN